MADLLKRKPKDPYQAVLYETTKTNLEILKRATEAKNKVITKNDKYKIVDDAKKEGYINITEVKFLKSLIDKNSKIDISNEINKIIKKKKKVESSSESESEEEKPKQIKENIKLIDEFIKTGKNVKKEEYEDIIEAKQILNERIEELEDDINTLKTRKEKITNKINAYESIGRNKLSRAQAEYYHELIRERAEKESLICRTIEMKKNLQNKTIQGNIEIYEDRKIKENSFKSLEANTDYEKFLKKELVDLHEKVHDQTKTIKKVDYLKEKQKILSDAYVSKLIDKTQRDTISKLLLKNPEKIDIVKEIQKYNKNYNKNYIHLKHINIKEIDALLEEVNILINNGKKYIDKYKQYKKSEGKEQHKDTKIKENPYKSLPEGSKYEKFIKKEMMENWELLNRERDESVSTSPLTDKTKIIRDAYDTNIISKEEFKTIKEKLFKNHKIDIIKEIQKYNKSYTKKDESESEDEEPHKPVKKTKSKRVQGE